MDKLTFYRYYSTPEIWSNLFNSGWTNPIPEGYDLVEKSDHKKKRLEIEQETLENNIEVYKRYLSEEEEKLKSIKKELKEL